MTHDLLVGDGQPVLDAALDAGVQLVHQCRAGTCSTCVGVVASGRVEMPAGKSIPLLAHELADGQRLLCIATATEDSVVDLLYPASLLSEDGPVAFTATVLEIEQLGGSVARLVIKAPSSVKPKFQPGQYMRLKVPGTGEWRSYSMASTARELPKLEFLVRLLPQGAMSDYLRDRAAEGDRIEVEGPLGAFVLRDSPARHIFVAGGTGIAPMLSMIEAIRRGPGRKPDMLLAFGCTRSSQFFLRDDLDLRASWLPSLAIRYTADTIDCDAPDVRVGTPLSAIGAEDVAGGDAVAYLCGPPGMIDAARDHLLKLGLPAPNILAEKFVAS